MKIMLTPILLLATLATSCGGGGGGGGGGNDAASVDLQEVSTNSPVPSAALNFDVNLNLRNFTGQQEAKVLEAAELIRKVVASDEFKNAILNHKYKGKKTFVNNNGLSNAQVYAKILEGSEDLRPGKNNTMDLDLEVYYRNDSVVGYTYPSVNKVWMNRKFLNQNPPHMVTTNMMHEWLHKLGFGHAVKNNPSRKYSVPYAVGYLTARLAAKHA